MSEVTTELPEIGSRWQLSKRLPIEWEVVEVKADTGQILIEQKNGLIGALRRPPHLASMNLHNGGEIPARVRRWVTAAMLYPVKESV